MALACANGSALASGFALREGSADWLANAFAGDTAKAYDASTVWTNPAGMVRLDRSEVDGSVAGIFPTLTFAGNNVTGPTAATPGTQGNNLIQSAATGGAFGVWSVLPDLKLGIAATAPFGQHVTNPGNFVGRYQSLVSSITDLAFTLAASYRVSDRMSIGGGPVIDRFAARLTQAINTGPLAGLAGDPTADLHGSDVSVGFNIGALYQVTPAVRIGLDYRSRIQHGITGTQSVAVPPLTAVFSPATAAQLNALNTAARTKVTLPDSVSLGLYYQVTPRWAVMSDVQWTDWSLVRSINVTPTTPGVPGSVLQENWRNTAFVSIGANYGVTSKLLLQGGAAYDESPVKDANRTSRIPDSDRFILSIGAQYAVLPDVTVQAAYAHVFFAGAPINNSASATAGVLVGSYSSSVETASLGVKVFF